jgi:hypothetical protein
VISIIKITKFKNHPYGIYNYWGTFGAFAFTEASKVENK